LNDCAMVTVPCLITVAAGVFAPGHLGELTRYLPFELADDVLEGTRTVQRRMRALPSRVGIYFVLAMALFPGIGYLRVWDKMTAALEDLGLPRPSEKALRDLRRRLGPAPADGGRRDQGARPGPWQRCPQARSRGGLARRVVPVPDRRPPGADHRGRPGRAWRRRDPAGGQLPADHHLAGLALLPGRGTGPPLP